MHYATEFSQTTAGYITGVSTPIIALLVGYFWRSMAKRFVKVEETQAATNAGLTETNKVLAILLSEHSHVMTTIKENSSSLQELREATAVLKSWRESHERWAENSGR